MGRERFRSWIAGHWVDSLGNSLLVFDTPPDSEMTVVVTPLSDHADAKDRVMTIRLSSSQPPRCGRAALEYLDEHALRLVWTTEDGRRSTWCGSPGGQLCSGKSGEGVAFPWSLHNAKPLPWLPLDLPRDVLYDGARVAALLDIRHMLGSNRESQERLTHILMDHDLHPNRGDYLIPGADSPLWRTLPAPESLIRNIAQRILLIPSQALSQNIQWSGESEVWVGQHKIMCRPRDIQVLNDRWILDPKDPKKPLEIARLLALYSVFDNPMSITRNGVHLGLDPELRRQSDYELFASPLNAAVGSGRFASKWPHVEWRFGSIGSYPSVLQFLPVNAVVCVNPPFTEAYLADVMARLAELKLRFRLRISIPIQEMPWRKKLHSSLPSAEFLQTYYDASMEQHTDVLHPTLLWEDPRCPARQRPLRADQSMGGVSMVPAAVLSGVMARGGTPLPSFADCAVSDGFTDGFTDGYPTMQGQGLSDSSPSPVGVAPPRSRGHTGNGYGGGDGGGRGGGDGGGGGGFGGQRPRPAASASARMPGGERSPCTPVVAPQAKKPARDNKPEGLDADEWPSLSNLKGLKLSARGKR